MKTIFLMFTCLFFLTSCEPLPTPIPEFITPEEYQVYHDILVENPDMWNIPPGTGTMVFFDHTYLHHSPETVRSILGKNSLISERLMNNYLKANQLSYSLEDQFELGIPVLFVSNELVRNLVRGLKFAEQCEYSLQAIYPRPQYGGFYYLSRVGFDEQMKTALVYIEQSLCGGSGDFLILKKVAGSWKIHNFVIGLQSDLDLLLDDRLSADEHAVFDAVLNASDVFVLDSDCQYITVFDQTGLSDILFLDSRDQFPMFSALLPGVTEEMLDNLVLMNAEPFELAPKFTTDIPVVMVSWQDYWQLSQEKDKNICLGTINERLPEPIYQGWMRLSRVGFNQENNKALVYIDSFKCESDDYLLVLEKHEGIWNLADNISMSSLPNSNYFGHILFESNRDGNEEIFMMNADGSDQINVTNNAAIDFNPTWSPDRNSIAYNSGIDGNAEIFILNLEDMRSINITNFPAKDWGPDWSSDGSQIVFFTDRDGFSEIYTIQIDTFETFRLTATDAYDRQPTWSPDGKHIAFSSDRDGDWEIFLMDKDGKNITPLTNNEVFDLAPDWSPDGIKISFTSKQNGNWEIYIIDLITREINRLTNHPANDLNPIWSPDGKKIAFQSDRDGNLEIYSMNTDGSEQINLTNHPANDYSPDW